MGGRGKENEDDNIKTRKTVEGREMKERGRRSDCNGKDARRKGRIGVGKRWKIMDGSEWKKMRLKRERRWKERRDENVR